jgi:hypothetical protein
MLFLIAFIGAAIIALVLWKAMNTGGSTGGIEFPKPSRRPMTGPGKRPPVSGPDDDPDFLRQLDEKVRRRDDPPGA